MNLIEKLQDKFQKDLEDIIEKNPDLQEQVRAQEQEYLDLEEKKKILRFLKELKYADETIPKIFLQGSCFRLYSLIRIVWESAEPYYSYHDGHWVIKIGESYYDINGEIAPEYIHDKSYVKGDPISEASAYIHTHSNNLGTVYSKYKETI